MKQINLKAPKVEILIVDDNIINLNVVEEILQSYEMKVSTAESGFECLSMISENKYDIIFMDHMMPDMDGIETLKKIRQFPEKYYKMIPVIALTASDDIGIREKFLEIGFNDYMRKPIDIEPLNRCLCNFISAEKIIVSQNDRCEDNYCGMQIDGVDTKLGLKYSNGNMECYLSVLKSVCKEANKQKMLIQDYINMKNWKEYAVQVHGLKGVAASIGANDFASLAKKHEIAAKDADLAFIYYDFSNFMENYDYLLANIKKEIGKEYKFKEDIEHVNKLLSNKEVNDAIKLIEAFELENAIDKLKNMSGDSLTNKQNKAIATAIELLEDLSYEEAIVILISIL